MNFVKHYPAEDMNNIKAITMLILAMTLAGSSVVVGKVIVNTIPVFLGTFASLLVAFACMVPLMHGRLSELKQLTLRQWKYLFLQGLCGIVLFRVFTLYGLHSTGAIQAGIVTGTTPAIFAVLSFFLLGEQIGKKALLGIVLAMAGCIVINIFTGENGEENSLFGCLLVGAAVVCEALFTICRKQVAESVSATTNTTILIFCSLLLLAVPAAWDVHSMQSFPESTAFVAIIYYGVFATVIAYLLWTSAVGKVSGATAGITTAAMPASSVILATLLLDEQVHCFHLIGCLLIIAGILVTTVKMRKR